jgi:mRNA interferase RelE/StbE
MKVVYKKSAEKEIVNLPKNIAIRIADKIATLEKDPYPTGFKKLTGANGYRIRIGDYRVVYLIDKNTQIITIIKIKHRREVYLHTLKFVD